MVVWGDVYEALGRPLLAQVVREAGATLHDVGVTRARWVSGWERYLHLPQAQRTRVNELAGTAGANLSLSYQKRFADAVDAVERESGSGRG